MATDRYAHLSRAQLIDEVRRLEAIAREHRHLAAHLQELHAHQEQNDTQHDELVQAQRALEASRDFYEELFDFAPVGFASLDPNGIVEQLNLRAAALLESEREQILGMPFVIYVTEGDRRRFLDHMARCRHTAGHVETELSLKAKGGRSIPVQVATRPSNAGTAAARRYHTAITDLTERYLAEMERERILREEQAARAASEAKDRFLAVLSHELRTPLSPILYALGTLEAQGDVPDALRQAVDLIRRNVHLEARLIDDLLDMTRIGRGKLKIEPEVVDLHDVLADVLGLCREAEEAALIRVRLEPEAARHRVRGDPTRLRQIFWNLERNAIQATPPGGWVTIRTQNARRGTVTVTVSDTGVGIVPADLARLFAPFEQLTAPGRRNRGLGLGLSIAKGLVEAHGGSIGAHSDGPGTGATFEVELPTAAHDARPAARSAAPCDRDQATARGILLVEDNEDNAAALVALLKLHGYRVEVAGSVHDALEQANGSFDVLVSDLGLPDGRGLDLMRRLRASRPVRGIALSGYGTEDDVRRSSEAGFELHLTKPVDPGALIEAIERLSSRS